MNALPKWVYDLVADLLDEEDLHPKIYRQTLDGAYIAHDWCLATPLDRVPEAVMAAAVIVSQYRREQ